MWGLVYIWEREPDAGGPLPCWCWSFPPCILLGDWVSGTPCFCPRREITVLTYEKRMKSEKRLWQIGPATWLTIEIILGLAAMMMAFKLTPASLPAAGPQHATAGTAAALYA